MEADIHPSALIHPTAIIHNSVVIEANVVVFPYAVIGSPAEHRDAPQNLGLHAGRVHIGAGTVVREHVTIHASKDATGCTLIGANCFIQAHAHIGHDAVLADGVTVACFGCVGGHARIGRHANIGLHAVVHQFGQVPEGCMIGACAFVKGDTLQPFTTYVGVPARASGANWRLVERLANASPADPGI